MDPLLFIAVNAQLFILLFCSTCFVQYLAIIDVHVTFYDTITTTRIHKRFNQSRRSFICGIAVCGLIRKMTRILPN